MRLTDNAYKGLCKLARKIGWIAGFPFDRSATRMLSSI